MRVGERIASDLTELADKLRRGETLEATRVVVFYVLLRHDEGVDGVGYPVQISTTPDTLKHLSEVNSSSKTWYTVVPATCHVPTQVRKRVCEP